MLSHETSKILQHIIQGSRLEGKDNPLTAARNFLCASFSTNSKVKKDFERQSAIKEEQASLLKKFAVKSKLLLSGFPDPSFYLTEGGEAKIYFGIDNRTVIKVNDGVYYSTWLDFLNSLILHNLFFEDTKYQLIGFTETSNGFAIVLTQPFVLSDSPTDLQKVKDFLSYNGFENTRRNDYYNKELGLILEDIHDENVIVNAGKMFFIDTVFYIDVK